MDRLAEFLYRFRHPLLLAGVALACAAWFPSSRLAFDQSIESLYAENNPHLGAYLRSKHWFGGDEFAFVAFRDPRLLTPESNDRIRRLARELEAIPGVAPGSVQDLPIALSPARIPLISVSETQLIELVRGVLIGDDNETTAVVVRLLPEHEAPVPRAATVRRLRETAAAFDPAAHVVGEPVLVHEMFRYVEEDGLWLWIYSAGLLLLVILLFFHSLRWTLLPLLLVVATVLWTRGVLAVCHLQLSMVSSMLNSLVTIIGVATVMHVIVRFREHRTQTDPPEAFRRTVRGLAVPIFWTTVTTAAGFGALVSSSINPVQSFGLMMAVATMLVIVAALALLPGGMLLGQSSAEIGASPPKDVLHHSLGHMTDAVERHPLIVALVSSSVVAWALVGFFWLKVETDFSRNFRESSPILQGLNFLENHLGGAGVWEVNFSAPEEIDDEFLEKLGALATELRRFHKDGQPELTKVVCLADGVELIPRIPFFTTSVAGRMNFLRRFQPEFIPSLYNEDQHRMRLVLRARERQPSADKLRLIGEVEAAARRTFPDAETTGLFVLLTYLIESLMADQWTSFAIAGAAIFGLMAIAFRSLWIGLISLVPNVFPIVLVIGSMGWSGLPINIATAMIASVSMGLTVDSSIHYLSGYRAARQSGQGFFAALKATHQSVGRVLVLANVALVIGFLVLTASHFIPLVYFGLLVSVAMLGGLIGNLLFLPLLLRVGERV